MAAKLAGKTAIVTGGASGIGLAAVERLLDAGCNVVIADLNEENGRAAIDRLDGTRSRTDFVPTDVADEAQVEHLIKHTADRFGSLDVLFNNAGLGGAIGPIVETTFADWQRTFDILVGGVFLGIKHGARQMIAQGSGGAIINTASIAGKGAGYGPQAYSAAKAAVINLTESTAVELAPHRIRVNAICPGVIFTPLWIGGDEEGATNAIRGFQPWPDRGEPADIADAVQFLAGEDSGFITGQALVVDGGITAAHGNFNNARVRRRPTSTVTGFTYGTTGRPNRLVRLDEQ